MSRPKLDVGNTNLLHPHRYLPDEVIDNILVRLPIKDAVCTSILSRNYRFQWQKMSKLVFRKGSIPLLDAPQYTGLEQGALYFKLVKIIDSVLSLHVGPIRTFELTTCFRSFPDVDRWIVVLQRNHIKEIILKFSGGEPYRVPSHLFSCDQLTRLSLCHCELKPSLSFSVLPNLVTLVLINIRDTSGRVEALISSCRTLNVLALSNIEGPGHLKLHAPTLRVLVIANVYFDITVSDAPSIRSLSWGNPRDNQHLNQERRVKVANIINCLLKLERLFMGTSSLQWLFCGGQVLQRLPGAYEYMRKLTLAINFTVMEEFLAALCLLRSFPNLKALDIDVQSAKDSHNATSPNSCTTKDLNIIPFHQLQKVRVAKMTGSRRELLLVKCILANAPALRALEMSINENGRLGDNSKIFIELMRYPRASTVAEIVYVQGLAVLATDCLLS